MFALIDCSNFYASCERIWRPDLKAQPIVVLSNNDGCVIARSEEAKKIGVLMGAPFFKVKALCQQHDIQIFSSNFALYGDMSTRIMRIIENTWPEMEIYSIDEAFINLTTLPSEKHLAFCQALQEKILQYTSIPVSIGVGATKTLAKVANFIAKKSVNQTVFTFNNHDCWLAQMAVGDLWGIGRQLRKKLTALGVNTALDLKHYNSALARKQFSVVMERTILELNGISCLSLEAIKPKQSIMSSRSFGQLQHNFNGLSQATSHHCTRVWTKMRKEQLVAGYLSVFIQSNRFRSDLNQHHQSIGIALIQRTDDLRKLNQSAQLCLKQIYQPGIAYKKCGVWINDLTPNKHQQQDLFVPVDKIKHDQASRLMNVIEAINNKYGASTVRLATEGFDRSWQMIQEKKSPAYTTHWSQIPVVYAK